MDPIKLTNSEFDFEFNGQVYKIKRANLSQVIQFQRKAKEIGNDNDAGGDIRIVAYAIYLALYSVDKNITEDYVLENCPGDVDVMAILGELGFMSQQKVETFRKIQDALVNKGKQ